MSARLEARTSGLVIVCATLLACGSAEPRADRRTSSAAVTTSAPTTTTTPRRLDPRTDLEAVCEGDVFPSGAAYRGPSPHPTQAHGFGTLYGEYDEWPDPWPSWAPDKADASDIQLVLCEDRGDAEPTDLVCDYGPVFGTSGETRSLAVELDVADLKLYEVKTGDLVAEARITGPRECPETASVWEGKNTVTSFAEVAAYAEAVRTHVIG